VDLLSVTTSSPVTDLKHPPEADPVGALSRHGRPAPAAPRWRWGLRHLRRHCRRRNLVGTQAALKRAYLETESTVDSLIPDSRTGNAAADRHRHRRRREGGHLSARLPAADILLCSRKSGREAAGVVLPSQHFRYD
jgi:hypothetical protein